MKGILTSYKISDKYVNIATWLIVIYVIVNTLLKYPIFRVAELGDESSYRMEVDYLSQYGFYKSLSQGTSFVYTLLTYLCAKIFSVNFLVSARILTLTFFAICCKLLLKCFGQYSGMTAAEKALGITFFCAISAKWLTRGLPDIVSMSFFLVAYYIISSRNNNYKAIFLAGCILFLGFAVKPVILITIPGVVLFLLLKNVKENTWGKNMIKAVLLVIGFGICFTAYHIPGYLTYHKLMLENKHHDYYNGVRRENTSTWNEVNVYFELYNEHHKPNKWAITCGEVDSFKAAHPDINLKLTTPEFMKAHFAIWARNSNSNLFLYLPYHLQIGFFFAKWTAINSMVKNFFLIQLITLILISVIFLSQRSFIKQNILLFSVLFLFYVTLSYSIIPQLEDNWLLFCLPFLALPITKFLTKYVNIVVLLALQFIYLLVM